MIDFLLNELIDLVADVLDDLTALLLLGVVAGIVYLVRQHRRIDRLERELQALRRTMDIEPGSTAPVQAASASSAGVGTPGGARSPKTDREAARPVPPPPAPGANSLPGPSGSVPPPAREPFVQELSPSTGLVSRLMGGGNWLVRGGVLLLFAGVGFLLKFAADNALLPVELRLGGVMVAGGVLLALGLRLAPKRPAYAMALEGGGVGLVYLTLYAAFRLYGLLPAELAFGLMLVVVGCAGWLAWRQDALPLAVLGAMGGFAAPLLASTGSGSHVLLFGYYAVLNAGVLGLAFFRAWRVLNLVGFASTFLISALWGHGFYEPRHFDSVEPFLVLFFLMYLSVAVLFASRRSLRLRDPLDSTLVFGTPLVAFGLQAKLLEGSNYSLSLSALVLGGLYGALAVSLWRRADRPLWVLAEAFAAIAVGFGIIAVPLALDARWTSASWALEGAALLWVGWRQRRLLARLAGGLLQMLAGLAWLWNDIWTTGWNTADWLGSVMLAVAGLASSAVLTRSGSDHRGDDARPLGIVLGVWGLLWWYAGGTAHVVQSLQLRGDAWIVAAVLLYLCLSATALQDAGRRMNWAVGRVAAALLPMMLVPVALAQALAMAHPLQSVAGPAWLVALASMVRVLRREDARHGLLGNAGHVLGLWLVSGLLTWELAWWFQELLPSVRSWQRLAWLLGPSAVLALTAWGAGRGRPWPFDTRSALYLTVGAGPLVCIIGGGLLGLSVADPGAPWPLPYVPVLNPLDLGLAAGTAACVFWLSRARARVAQSLRNLLAVSALAFAFLWLNGALLRSFHFWAGIPYQIGALFQSTQVQAGLSVLWASAGLVTMVGASRAASRTPWSVGAALMVVVVAKLALVDLAGSGTIARIVSFISVGVLLMVVGYLAPVPPRPDSRP